MTNKVSQFPRELRPDWLGGIAEAIFAALPADENTKFMDDFFALVPTTRDMEPVRDMLAVMRLDRLIERHRQHIKLNDLFPIAISALKSMRRCHENELLDIPSYWADAELSAWGAFGRAIQGNAQNIPPYDTAMGCAVQLLGVAGMSPGNPQSSVLAALNAAQFTIGMAEAAREERNDLLGLCILGRLWS